MSVRVELRRDAGKIEPAQGPWIRRQQVARVLGPPDPAAIGELVDHRGRTLGFGLYSPESAIVLRMLSFGERPIEAGWLGHRLDRALSARASLGLRATDPTAPTTGFRELNSEGDGVPGLVIDRFGTWRVVQITTAPIAARRAELLARLRERDDVEGTIVIAPAAAAEREGFSAGVEVLGDPAGPAELRWREHGLELAAAAPQRGPAQKTGAYHDQRENRARLAALLGGSSLAGPVLDLGSHIGGFSLAAARVGREVVAVDQSRDALAWVERNTERNGLRERVRPISADMFGPLDEPALAGPFAAIVFDPPKIASSRRDLPRALGAMTRTIGIMLGRLHEGGLLLACSCSHHLNAAQLDRAMLDAGQRSGRPCTVVGSWGPGPDHPVWPGHAEGEYLRVQVYQRR